MNRRVESATMSPGSFPHGCMNPELTTGLRAVSIKTSVTGPGCAALQTNCASCARSQHQRNTSVSHRGHRAQPAHCKKMHARFVSSTLLKINVLHTRYRTEKKTQHNKPLQPLQLMTKTYVCLDNRQLLLAHLSIKQSIKSTASFRLANQGGSLIITTKLLFTLITVSGNTAHLYTSLTLCLDTTLWSLA